MATSRTRVYIACSLDGFIAGPGNDLSWLPGADPASEPASESIDQESSALGFEEFMSNVGVLLMGRGTYDVVAGFEGQWAYGERPVLVATHRPLEPSDHDVKAVSGDIEELVAAARQAAGGKDVYLDGGHLIRQALDAGLVDDLVVTMVPILLGQGHPLFAGVAKRHPLEFTEQHRMGSMLQVHCRPLRS